MSKSRQGGEGTRGRHRSSTFVARVGTSTSAQTRQLDSPNVSKPLNLMVGSPLQNLEHWIFRIALP